ncbi:hypothetical protein MCUN1_000129 [Malassezia cuniculi]|uniref:Autophagy-related protein 14 n=1 Tax=Malassezia cuniculi TaxID=948313 RepID=A0AAF0J9H5_9BASI|nr:hypothetical protein MCUN1_000129 [Malassezia cuniculi]
MLWEQLVDLRDLVYTDTMAELPAQRNSVYLGFRRGSNTEYAVVTAQSSAADNKVSQSGPAAAYPTTSYSVEDIHDARDCRAAAAARAARVLGTDQSAERASAQLGAATKRIKETVAARRAALVQDEQALDARRAALQKRRDHVNDIRARTEALGTWERECAAKVDSARVSLDDMHSDVCRARSRVLQALEAIYPIELVDARELLYSIAGIPLANGVAPNASKSELDDSAAALGLVAQLVVLLSTYLSTPLPYPIVATGSRAVIKDGISVMQGPRACVVFSLTRFTLYGGRGIEHYRYEYAVFLLSKDIEQLMNAHGVPVLDLRSILPNLKNLLVTLIAATRYP